MINLNQAATSSPKAPGVADAVFAYLHGDALTVGRGARVTSADDILYETRVQLSKLFHAPSPRHVVFTSGVTAALNMVLGALLTAGDHVVTTSLDHNAVLRPLELATARGVTYDVAWADGSGRLSVDAVAERLRPNTRAVVMTSASNVCGTTLPLAEVGSLCQAHDLIFIVDAAQDAGSRPLECDRLAIDALCFTGHKSLLGPQGVGGVVLSDRLAATLPPFMAGGTGSRSDQLTMPKRLPDRLEPGTPNIPGIVGLNAALTYVTGVGMASLHTTKRDLTARWLDGVRRWPRVRVVGPGIADEQVGVVSLVVEGVDLSWLADALAEAGVLTRPGLHCAPLAHKTLGTFPEGTLRVSFSPFHTNDDVDEALSRLEALL